MIKIIEEKISMKHSHLRNKNLNVIDMCMTNMNNKLELANINYNDIETEVGSFVLDMTSGTKTIVTGSSDHMIEKVENVVKDINPNYDVIDNGIRIWKAVA